jgi:hypothetical protein
MERSWEMWAGRRGDLFVDVGPHPTYVRMHGHDKPAPVRVVEDPDGPYWGWQEKGHEQEPPVMIYEHKTLFNICFPYGVQAEVDAGHGRVLRLRVESLLELEQPQPEQQMHDQTQHSL